MPRPRTSNVKTNIMLDADSYDMLRLILMDPRNPDRIRYGALGKILNGLLRQFLVKLNAPGTDKAAFLEAYGVKLTSQEEPENDNY